METLVAEPRAGQLRRAGKRLMLWVAWLAVSPLVVASWLEERWSGPDSARAFGTGKEILAIAPGLFGSYARLAFYWSTCRAVSPDVAFNLGSMVSVRDVAIGAGTVIGAHSIVGRAQIGERVMVASRVSILADRFEHGRPADRAAGRERSETAEPVRIGDSTWIGENAVVMAHVGSRCTVAAGSVVVRPVRDGATCMGNPARQVNLEDGPA